MTAKSPYCQGLVFSANPTQMDFMEIEIKNHIKFTCNHNRPQTSKTILRMINKIGTVTSLHFKTYSQTTRAAWTWHTEQHICHWDRRECSEISPGIYNQLQPGKTAKNAQWGVDYQTALRKPGVNI